MFVFSFFLELEGKKKFCYSLFKFYFCFGRTAFAGFYLYVIKRLIMEEYKLARMAFGWKLFLLIGIILSNFIFSFYGEGNDSTLAGTLERLHGFSDSRFFTLVAVNVVSVLLVLMWRVLCRSLTEERRLTLGVLAFIYALATLFCVWNLSLEASLALLLGGIPIFLLYFLVRWEIGS